MENKRLGDIRGVFFDLGGTLFHHLNPDTTARNLLQTLSRVERLTVDKDVVIQRYREQRQQAETAALFKSFYMHRGLVAQAYTHTVSTLPGSPSSQEVAEQTSEFCNLQAACVADQLSLRQDTLATLDALRKRGLFVAIVSNIDDNYIEPLIDKWKLAEHIDYWISSERALSCKPHNGIFRQALRGADIPAHQVLFVGDSIEHDVVGAHRLGMKTAFLNVDHPAPVATGADIDCRALNDLLDKI